MNKGKSWSDVKKNDGDRLYEDVICSLHIFKFLKRVKDCWHRNTIAFAVNMC